MFLMTRWCPWWHDDVHGYTIMFMVYLLCLYSHEKVRFTYLFFKLQNTFFQVTEYFYLDIFPRMTCLFFLKSTLCQWSDQIVLWTDRWQNINFCLAAKIFYSSAKHFSNFSSYYILVQIFFLFIHKTFLKIQVKSTLSIRWLRNIAKFYTIVVRTPMIDNKHFIFKDVFIKIRCSLNICENKIPLKIYL